MTFAALPGPVAEDSTTAMCRDRAERAEVNLDIDMTIFEDLSPQVQADIREKMTSAAYKRGDFGESARTTLCIHRQALTALTIYSTCAVMKRDDMAEEVFFVKSGIVETSATDPEEDDEYKISAIVERGDCFGDEVIFARDKHRMKYARCRTDVEVLKLKKEDLHSVLEKSGDARKLEKAVQKQSGLSFTTDC